MVSLESLIRTQQNNPAQQYRNCQPLNIFDSPKCERLATQAIVNRHIRFDNDALLDAKTQVIALPVILVEDDYPGWLSIDDLQALQPIEENYQATLIERQTIADRMDDVIRYALDAMKIPNEYLWGGAVGPNLDCSGLVQCSFGSQEIWMPRDAYQQEAFTETIDVDLENETSIDDALTPGDLVFFGTPEKATHVAIYLGDGEYIHSSGKDQGRNGIGIDSLIDLSHPVSENYRNQYRCCGRVMQSFCP